MQVDGAGQCVCAIALFATICITRLLEEDRHKLFLLLIVIQWPLVGWAFQAKNVLSRSLAVGLSIQVGLM